MRFLLRTARKDLIRRAADPVALMIWIGIPLAIGVLWGLAVGGDGGGPTVELLVADRDSSFASRLVVGAGAGGPAGRTLDVVRVADEREGRRRIDEGEGTALLVIPEGFGSAVVGRDTVALTLVTNPSQRILPDLVEKGASMLTEAIFYLQEIAGPSLQALADGPPEGEALFGDAAVAEIPGEVNRRLRGVEDVLFPPVLSVEFPDDDEDEPDPGFGVLFLPGLVFMSLTLVAQGMSDDLWAEEEGGTLERALATPHGAAALLGGKVVAGVLIIAVIVVAALAVGAAAFAVPPARAPVVVVWCTYAGAALLAIFFLLQTLASGRRGGNLLTTLVVFPLLMVGGSFFPFEAMPEWMAAVGRWTPNGLAVVRMKALLFGEPAAAALAGSAAGIGAVGAAAFVLCARRIRGLSAGGDGW